MKKTLAIALALLIALCQAASADGYAGELLDTAEDLFFRTTNVTVACEAKFTYDGEWFKTLHGSYRQDGFNSHLSWMLDTPRADGSVYTGGYLVTGIGDTAYASDTYNGNYYYTTAITQLDTLFTLNPQRAMTVAAAKAVLSAAEDQFHALSIAPAEDGSLAVELGDLPEMADTVLWFLASDYLWENYYISLWNEPEEDAGEEGVYIWTEDWRALVAARYFAIYGEELPEMIEDEVTQGRFNVAMNAEEQFEEEIRAQYDHGYVFIAADGSHEWFETEEECMRRAGAIDLNYEDYLALISAYYESLYGAPLTEDEWRLLIVSTNEELQEALMELEDGMDQHYRELARQEDPNAVRINVRKDGSYTVQAELPKWTPYRTVAQEIRFTTQMAEIVSAKANVERDGEGRIASVRGDASFALTDVNGEKHTLDIEFDFTAGDYGTTEVSDVFDPAEYGLVSFEEFAEAAPVDVEGDPFDWDTFMREAPDTIDFMGRLFETGMADYLSEGE